MLVIGTMDWPKTLESGQFFCPACEAVQAYRRRASRPFLTVYFIPVIPIGGLHEYVECRKCQTSFEPIILGDQTPESDRSFATDMIRVAALTMLEDQKVTEAEIAQAIAVIRAVGQRQVTRDELGAMCSELRSRQLQLGGFLFTAKQRWTRDESLRMLQVIFLVSSAEGQISEQRMTALLNAQKALQLSDQEVEMCVTEAEQWPLQ